MKRNRTPPVELHESDEDVRTLPIVSHPFGPCVHLLIKIKFDQEWEVVVAPPPYEQITGLRQPEFEPVQDKSTPPQVDSHAIEQDDTPVREVELPSSNRNSCLIDLSSLLHQQLHHSRKRKG